MTLFDEALNEALQTGKSASRTKILTPSKITCTVSNTHPNIIDLIPQVTESCDSNILYVPSQNFTKTPKQSLDEILARYRSNLNLDIYKAFPKEAKKKALCKPFSSAFYASISINDQANFSGLDDFNLTFQFWCCLLETITSQKYANHTESEICNIIRLLQDMGYVFYNTNQGLKWKLHHDNAIGFISLLSFYCGVSRIEAVDMLGKILSMHPKNLVRFSSTAWQKKISESCSIRENIPDRLVDGNEDIESKLLCISEIKDNSGKIIGAFLRYQMGQHIFCIPAGVQDEELCIGKCPPPACFLNQHLFDAYPNATIVLFQDMRIAMLVQMALNELKSYNPKEFIISSHLETDLKPLSWHYVTGHKIVFIPSPDTNSIYAFKEYFNFAKGFQARNIKISDHLFFQEKFISQDWISNPNITADEKRLLEKAIVLPECENIIPILRKTITEALDQKQYNEWCYALGLLKETASSIQAKDNDKKLDLHHSTLLLPKPHKLEELDLTHTIRPGSYLLIGGEKGSGKTHLCLSIIRSLLYPTNGWPFFKFSGSFQENICLVDGETPFDEFQENLMQYSLDAHVGKRLFCLAALAEDLPEFCQRFSLRDEIFRKGLFDFIIQNKCRILILDSLLLLTESQPNSCVKEVLVFIKELQRAGIAIVLTNHKFQDDKNKMRGNEDYYNEARVVINLVGKNAIIADKDLPENLRDYAQKNGITAGLEYCHHKVAPILERKIFYFHLPYGHKEWQFLHVSGLEEIPAAWQKQLLLADKDNEVFENLSQIQKTAVENLPVPEKEECEDKLEALKTLHPNVREVYKQLKSNGSATREQLEDRCKMSKDCVLAAIKVLKDFGMITSSGNGRGRFYIISK